MFQNTNKEVKNMSDLLNTTSERNDLSNELVDLASFSSTKMELLKIYEAEKFINRDKEKLDSVLSFNKINSCLGLQPHQISPSLNTNLLESDLNTYITNFLLSYHKDVAKIDVDELDKVDPNIALTPKEAVTIQIHNELKVSNNFLQFLHVSQTVLLLKSVSYDLINKAIDKDLFARLTVETALNEPPTNCLAIADNTELQVLMQPFFEYTIRPEYLNKYHKSAQRQLMENIYKLGLPFDINNGLPGNWDYLADNLTYPFDMAGVFDKVSFFNNPHPQAYFENMPTFIDSIHSLEEIILTENNLQRQAKPSFTNRTKLEYLDEVFLSAISSKESDKIPKFDLSDYSPDIIKARLVQNLQTLIQSMIYISKNDSGFIDDLARFAPPPVKAYVTAEYIKDKLSKNKELFEHCRSLVYDRVRSILINSCNFSRKEASNIFKDIDEYQHKDYFSFFLKSPLDKNFLVEP